MLQRHESFLQIKQQTEQMKNTTHYKVISLGKNVQPLRNINFIVL